MPWDGHMQRIALLILCSSLYAVLLQEASSAVRQLQELMDCISLTGRSWHGCVLQLVVCRL
jgi:hypothetical protein